MGEGEAGEETGEGRKRGWKLGMHEKIASKSNVFGIWGRPLGATTQCHTF